MQQASLARDLTALARSMRAELIAIADWWVAHTQDLEQGGFYGEVDAHNQPVKNASKGVILNARLLWFFSEAARATGNARYAACATRAFDYLLAYFYDAEQGGFYWELDAAGKPINTKKQIYAQGFVIYGLSAYHQLTQNPLALSHALDCFALIEQRGRDRAREGYLEAFTRDWKPIEDLRLSDKDLNYPKSQNTHLHVLEAYTSLYQIAPRAEIKAALRYNIHMFDKYMINRSNYHLRMFMDLDWQDFSPGFTYGHDIEAAWLIGRALDVLGDSDYRATLMPDLIRIAQTTLHEAIGPQGQVMDALDFASGNVSPDNVWWVQAEALVGFLYMYQETAQPAYLDAAESVWAFIANYQRDTQGGEWLWLSKLDKPGTQPDYKAGFWKCPYHNGRAMLEAEHYLLGLDTYQ